MDLFGALSLYGPQLGNPLNLQAQAASQYQLLVAQMACNARQFETFKREAFYRSCSRHWLNAMLDVELGPP